MTQNLTWYGDDGLTHPLLFLPEENANSWGGVDNRTDFEPEIKEQDDFIALCSITEAASRLLVEVIVDNTSALVLVTQEPCSTAWVPHAKGGFFVQAIYTENEETFPVVLAKTDLYAVMDEPDDTWRMSAPEFPRFTILDKPYILMNSLYTGPDDPIATEKPLPIEIEPGTYNIKVGRWTPDEESEYLIYRLSKED